VNGGQRRWNRSVRRLRPGGVLSAGNSPESVVIADLDGDGDNDFAVANFVSDNVSVLLNTATS